MIIVTGAAGLIGSAIIWDLNNRGFDDILAVDQLGGDERWKNLRGIRFRDYMEKTPFIEMLQDDALPEPVEAIIHMGACSDTTERNASYLIQNNFEYTKALARWATDRKVRFIYASSAATYGDGSRGYTDSESELDQLAPLNMYGYSKHLFDLWARRQGLLDRIVGLKYFNVFGPNEYHKGDMRSVVIKAFEQILDNGRVRLFRSHRSDYRDGEQKRDFLYVKDAARMTLHFLDNRDAAGLFNIGSGTARTWNELVNAIFSALGQSPRIEYIDMPDHLRDRYQYFTEADMTRFRGIGGPTATTPLTEAVRDYVCEYLQPGAYLSSRSGQTSTNV